MENYKEKLRLAKEALDSGSYDKETIEYIFPELIESGDERIRKEIISFLKEGKPYYCPNSVRRQEWFSWLEKQGEQKPTCPLDNSRSNVSFPFKAKIKSSGVIVTIHDGQLSPDGKEWIKYQSDRKDGYKVYEPNNLELVCEIEQKPWSEEDEKGLGDALWAIEQARTIAKDENDMGNLWYAEHFLKSLKERYSWKPSDEQMKGIECAIKTLQHQLNIGDKRLDSLYDDLKKLKE